jgi:hypothetical protein
VLLSMIHIQTQGELSTASYHASHFHSVDPVVHLGVCWRSTAASASKAGPGRRGNPR